MQFCFCIKLLVQKHQNKLNRYHSNIEIFSADPTLLKTTVGVFVNLMSDNRTRSLFKNNKGVSKLLKILSDYCENDWLLGNLVCQVLWNYSIDTIDLHELFSEDEIQQLLVILADFLGK